MENKPINPYMKEWHSNLWSKKDVEVAWDIGFKAGFEAHMALQSTKSRTKEEQDYMDYFTKI